MKGKIAIVVALVVVGILAGVATAKEKAEDASLREQLKAQYKLAKLMGVSLDTAEGGTVLTIEKPGILGGSRFGIASRYRGGVLHAPDKISLALMDDSIESVGQEPIDKRPLPVGDKVYVLRINASVQREWIQFDIVECNACNGVTEGSPYESTVEFEFPKGYLESASLSQVEDTIAQVFAIDTGQAEAAPEQPAPPTSQPAPAEMQAPAGPALTNDDIIKLVQVKLADSVIIAKIKSSACAFDTSTDGLVRLKQAGVSDAVLQAMFAAEGGAPAAQLAPGSQAPAASATAQPVILSKDILLSRGFGFADQPRAMCSIKGPDGPCQVEAFVFGESHQDPAAYTCSKLDRASYVGHCVGGALEGVSVVIADGSTKEAREAFVSYFSMGRMAYPALTSSFNVRFASNFGVWEKSGSYGCVYFGKWDQSTTRASCPKFMDVYGSDIFTESNAQALRDGTFNLSHYGAKFIEYAQGK